MLYSILVCAPNTQGKGFITEGHKGIEGKIKTVYIWIVVTVIGPYAFVKFYLTVYFKGINCNAYKLYLNKPD